jgi:hypothetical protein
MRDRVREERAQDGSASFAQLRELFGPPPVLSTENPKAGLCGSHLRRVSFTADLGSPASGGGARTGAREIGSTICDRLFAGETLFEICRDAAMPDKPTVMRWLAQDPTFLDDFVFTYQLLAEVLAGSIADNADTECRKRLRGAKIVTLSVREEFARLRRAIRHWVVDRLIRKNCATI